jgi:hypothetical protein
VTFYEIIKFDGVANSASEKLKQIIRTVKSLLYSRLKNRSFEPKQRAHSPQRLDLSSPTSLAAGLASESKIKQKFLNGGREALPSGRTFPAATRLELADKSCCRELFNHPLTG